MSRRAGLQKAISMKPAGFLPRLMWGRLLHSVRDRLAEWGSAAIMVGCGYVLAFSVVPIEGSLSHLVGQVHQLVWAKVFLGVGLIRLAILGINGALVRSPHYRTVCSLLSLLIWLQLVMSTFAISPWAFGFIAASGLVLMDAIAMLRAAMEAAYTDKQLAGGNDK